MDENMFDLGLEVATISADLPDSVITLSGADSYTVQDTADYPLLALSLYGKSTQDGTPTPDAPVDIVSVGDDGTVEVTACGKNLLPYPYEYDTMEISGLTFTVNGSGTIAISGTTTAMATFRLYGDGSNTEALAGVAGGKTYKLSENVACKVVNSAGQARYVNTTVTLAEDEIITYVYIQYGADVTVNTTLYPMIRLAGTDDTYEPYKGNTAFISSGMPLCSVGDVRDELVYNADGTGKIIKRTLHISSANSSPTKISRSESIYSLSFTTEQALLNTKGFCSATDVYNFSTSATVHYYFYGNKALVFLPVDYDYSAQPVSMVGILKTPQEIELSVAEMALLQKLQSYENTTSIYNDEQAEMLVKMLRREYDMKYIEWLKESQTWICPKAGKWKVIAVGGGAGGNFSFSASKKGALAFTGNGGTTSFGSIVSALGGAISEDSIPGAQADLISGQGGYNGMSIGGSGIAMRYSGSMAVSLNQNCGLSTDGEGYGASGGCVGIKIRFNSGASSGASDVEVYPISTPHGQIESTIVDLVEGQSVICTIGKGGKPSTTAERLVEAAKINTSSVTGISEENLSLAQGLAHPGRDGVIVVQYLGY